MSPLRPRGSRPVRHQVESLEGRSGCRGSRSRRRPILAEIPHWVVDQSYGVILAQSTLCVTPLAGFLTPLEKAFAWLKLRPCCIGKCNICHGECPTKRDGLRDSEWKMEMKGIRT